MSWSHYCLLMRVEDEDARDLCSEVYAYRRTKADEFEKPNPQDAEEPDAIHLAE